MPLILNDVTKITPKMDLNFYFHYLLRYRYYSMGDVWVDLVDYCDTSGKKPNTIPFPNQDPTLPLMSSWDERNKIPI